MNAINIEYIPLTFISSIEDKKTLIKNTLIMKHILTQYNDVRPLSELLESTQYGYTASAENIGTHKFLRITDIQNGFVNWDSVPYCNCDKEEKYLVQRGDILIARTGGTTGKSFLIPDNAPSNVVFASYLIKLRTKIDLLLPEYLHLFLNSYLYWSQISEMKSGSAQPNVNAEKLKLLQIPYCDVDTQKEVIEVFTKNSYFENKFGTLQTEIQNVLDKMDTLYEVDILIQEQLNLVSAYRNAVLMQAVQGKLVEHDPNDETASELLKRIREEKERLIKEKKIKKEKPLPPISPEEIPYELPKGWEWVRLGEIVRVISGKTINSQYEQENGDIIYLKVSDMNLPENSKEIKTSSRFVDYKTYFREEELIPAHSIIFPKRGGAIATNKKRIIIQKMYVDSNIMALSVPELINLDYIYYWFNTIDLWKLNSGTSVPQINNKDIEPILVPIPPKQEQKRIVDKINEKMDYCNKIEEQIKKLKKDNEMLMKAILQEVFM